jgi:uncharacterized protein YbjT (DUF2867 family)
MIVQATASTYPSIPLLFIGVLIAVVGSFGLVGSALLRYQIKNGATINALPRSGESRSETNARAREQTQSRAENLSRRKALWWALVALGVVCIVLSAIV